MDVYSARPLLGDDIYGIYKLLGHLPCLHCVDVGAASGGTVRLMKQYSVNATVDAFEPFPGNFRFLEQEIAKHDGIILHKVAVSATEGSRSLAVPGVVEGHEPGWEDRVGYSSGSHLVSDASAKNHITVECVSLNTAVKRRISFLKIDVQGTELDVLQSADRHFEEDNVDLCFVEFSGNDDILRYFENFGFYCFATPILFDTREGVASRLVGVNVIEIKRLSNGCIGEYAWDHSAPVAGSLFSEHIRNLRKIYGRVQTDLIFVAPRFYPSFLAGCADYAARKTPQKSVDTKTERY